MGTFSVVCAVAGARYGSCEAGSPTIFYVLFFVLVLAAQVRQVHIAYPSATDAYEKVAFLWSCGLGCAEMYDFFTDGQQIAQAYLCDSDLHEPWLESFQQAHSLMYYVVGTFHMWGILAVCQVLAVLLQGMFILVVSLKGSNEGGILVTSGFVGLGGLQRASLAKEQEGTGSMDLLRAICVGLPETMPGLVLQPSLFALTFAYTDAASQNKQLLSLAISWAMALKVVAAVLPSMRRGMRLVSDFGKTPQIVFGVLCFLPGVIFVVGAIATVIVGMLRVYHAYECKDHLWNVFSGCVHL